ncbi:hypothetical protein KIPB_005636 [Kipferlia bialata]|uniref:Kelch-type beta propeller n=1 Tax=Kipferlia bialata TaxID=797122 RepID=A0A391P2Q0_9EUKA|nr:hypothetical protein KIPB_005636 [Kipferlia bialata]|eukprot:g5636.t1
MLTYTLERSTNPEHHWVIITLSDDLRFTSARIAGPAMPIGDTAATLRRVADCVVAISWSERVMGVYSIATDEWESVPFADGLSVQWPYIFSVGDSLVVSGGNTEEGFNCSNYDTWEWSVTTPEWSKGGRCPRPLVDAAGSTHDLRHVIYSVCCLLPCYAAYDKHEWTSEPDIWAPVPVSDTDTLALLAVTLYGQYQLLVLQAEERGYATEFWIHDTLSQDRVLVKSLPTTNVNFASLIWLNSTTLLLASPTVSLLINVDPHLLGPEFQISMVGSSNVLRRSDE